MGERIFDNLMIIRTPRLAPRAPGTKSYSEMKWLPDPSTGLVLPEDVLTELDRGVTVKGWQFIIGQRDHNAPTVVPACRVHEIRLALIRRRSVVRVDRWSRAAIVPEEEIPDALR